ncbi:MAG: hypothetical protein Q3971_07420 [Moraxella sp.]|nr:hypothetical protein [Moraxella sp.]
MITQLKLLEQAVSELKERYHITATELVNLKNKMSHDNTPHQLATLQSDLKSAKDTITALTQTNADLEAQLAELCKQNQALIAQNQELTEKNALAISRAEAIQNWLAKIDHVD